jgi:hypothetical protein
MRRWVCIIALLAGFSADGYTRSVRLRIPVAIERPLDEAGGVAPTTSTFATTRAWWRRP